MDGMSLYTLKKVNTYYDSVSLMVLSSSLSAVEGIQNAAVMMGTAHNQQLMKDSNLFNEEFESASANDLLIGLDYTSAESLEEAQQVIDDFFNNKKKKEASGSVQVKSLDSALKRNSDSNLAILSVPGRY